jgi:hypothetical protein
VVFLFFILFWILCSPREFICQDKRGGIRLIYFFVLCIIYYWKVSANIMQIYCTILDSLLLCTIHTKVHPSYFLEQNERLMFKAIWTMYLLYISWREQVTVLEMMMISALYDNNMLSWIFTVLAHCNNSSWVYMSFQSDILSWFRGSQSLHWLLKAARKSNKY